MRPGRRHGIGLLAAAALALALQPAHAQTAAQPAAPASASLVDQLMGPETPATDVDVAALRQQAANRIQSKADAVALRRPPMAPQLLRLPHFDFPIVFDPDTAVIRPQSYQAIGRIADALTDPKLRPYAFLVVDHTESTGARAANLTLSQRRADAIRAALTGFRVAPAQLQALGLGEEQLQDAARPTSQANLRAQIVTLGTLPPVEPPAAGSAPAKKGAATKKKRQ